jgi:hypothetical protein
MRRWVEARISSLSLRRLRHRRILADVAPKLRDRRNPERIALARTLSARFRINMA